MQVMTGASRQDTSFAGIDRPRLSLAGSLALCIGAGVLIVVIDALFRFPLQLPGWRGLSALALVVLARCVSGHAWGASATAASAAVASLVLAGPPWAPLFYLVPGLVVDALCLLAPAWRDRTLFLALAAGIGHAGKFLGALVLGASGPRLAAVLTVVIPLLPLASHFVFGFAGGFVGAQIWKNLPRRTP